jgi:nucleosome assembly protein 1-like 1
VASIDEPRTQNGKLKLESQAMEKDLETYSKKQLIQHMQSIAPPAFLQKHKIAGAKSWERMTKEAAVAIFRQLDSGSGDSAAPQPAPLAPEQISGTSPAPAGASVPATTFNFSPGTTPLSSGLPSMFVPTSTNSGTPGPFQFNFNLGSGGNKDDDDEDQDQDEDRPRGTRSTVKRTTTSAALTTGLGALTVGGAVTAGSTANADARIRALKALQAEQDKAQEEYEEKVKALERELDAKTKPLAAKRKAIVTGAEAAEGADAAEPIAGFWLTAMANNASIAELIQPHDEPILEHLIDVALHHVPEGADGKEGFTLSFEFAPNEFFENSALTKTYVMDSDDEDTLDDVRGTKIAWKEGKNVTVKTVTKKQKKKGKERTVTVEQSVESWFSFFAPPAVPEEDAEMEDIEANELQAVLEDDYHIACILRDKIVPGAVDWFLGAPRLARAHTAAGV